MSAPGSNPVSLTRGSKLGPYEILGLLGAGGMGEVYRARDSQLGRDVAIKVLPRAYSTDVDRLRRFEQEARAAAALNHPNILVVHQLGTYEGSLYVVSEILEGETLRKRLMAGALPVRHAVDYAVQMARGLAAAHEKGITHRDLKPENVFITRDGRVKILDFGLAKLTRAEEGAATVTHCTHPGTVMGTVGYMSPEQVRGQAVDHRSDVFSLGVVLYEMLFGKRAFRGESSADVMSAILKEDPPELGRSHPDILPALGNIVRRCLEKNAEERFQSARDVAFALEALSGVSTGQAVLSNATRSSRKQMLRVSFVVILLLAALFIMVRRERVLPFRLSQGRPIADQLQLQNMRFAPLTTTGTSPSAAISPDGKYVAYVVEESSKQKLVLEHLATRSVAVVFPPAANICCGITFSRDGNYIYYVASSAPAQLGDAYQVPLLGGNARKVALDLNGGLATSPDGHEWAFTRYDIASGHSSLIAVNEETLKERVLGTRPSPQIYWGTPAWSPDGTQVAVGVHTVGGGHGPVVTIPASGGQEKQILAGDRLEVDSLAWLADRSGLVLVGKEREMPSQLWLLSYPDGALSRISNDLNSYSDVSLTADSTQLLCVEKQTVSGIWVLGGKNLGNPQQIKYGTDLETDGGIAWTPEGKLIFPSRVGGAVNLWMMGPDGSNARQLTEQDGNNDEPAVSPDGRTIVFVSRKSGAFNLWRMTVDGSHLQQLTRGNSDNSPQISPNGDWVVFVSRRTGKPTLWKIRADGKNEVQLTTDYGHTPVISPDGKFIAFNHLDAEQHSQAAIMSFAGGRPLKTLGVAAPWTVRWPPDGLGLTFGQSGDNFSNVWRQPLNGGKPTRLTQFTDQEISDYAWSKNGDLAMVRKRSSNDVVLLKLR